MRHHGAGRAGARVDLPQQAGDESSPYGGGRAVERFSKGLELRERAGWTGPVRLPESARVPLKPGGAG